MIAPIIIMPSIPRLSTPDFSVTSSPNAANNKGVAAVIIVNMAAMIIGNKVEVSIIQVPLAYQIARGNELIHRLQARKIIINLGKHLLRQWEVSN